ncbi:MAG: sulfur carrier protein ThiS [Spartobacteria bacterium]
MTIFVNGEGLKYDEALTVDELIRRHQLSAATILVELNGSALHRRDWSGRQLKENDRVEVLQVAAGG